MHCYTFLSDESVTVFDIVVYLIIMVNYSSLTYEHLVLDSELSTCLRILIRIFGTYTIMVN